jgi:hypothetical protein
MTFCDEIENVSASDRMLRNQVVGGPVEQDGYQPLVRPTPQAATTASSSYGVPKFNRRNAIGIGTTLIVAAVLGMIMNFIDLMYTSRFRAGEFGHGFWVGAAVSKMQSYCLVDIVI